MQETDQNLALKKFRTFSHYLIEDKAEYYKLDDVKSLILKCEDALVENSRNALNDFKEAHDKEFKAGIYQQHLGGTLISAQQEEAYRKYDLPGTGYFTHLLNMPLTDYNIIDLLVMFISISASIWFSTFVFKLL